ncbi:MAG: PAS domain S-box protein [Candidatus Thermoplasmatota archaeon]|jgi:PAS domain S-box-containing protein|nr:PAS domain S-box protein [Candidatus Thermoplasmatota archaeon]
MLTIDAMIYKSIFSRLMEPICIVDTSGTIIDVNHSMEMLLGYEAGELAGKTTASLLVQESLKKIEEILKETENISERTEEVTLTRNDGTSIVRNIKFFSVPDEQGNRIFCFQIPLLAQKYSWLGDIFASTGVINDPDVFVKDIISALPPDPRSVSEAMVPAPVPREFIQPVPIDREAKELTKDIEELMETFGPPPEEGLVMTDVDGKITEHNDYFLKIAGLSDQTGENEPEKRAEKEKVVGRYFGDFLATDHKDDFEEVLKSLRGNSSVGGIKTVFASLDDKNFPVALNGITIRDENADILGFILVIQKIEVMGVRRARLQLSGGPSLDTPPIVKSVVDLVKEGIVVTDIKGIITGLNSYMEEIIVQKSSYMQGKTMLQLFPEEDRERASLIIKNIESEGKVENHEFRLITGDGAVIPAILDWSLIEDEDGTGVGMMLVVRKK